MVTNILLTCRKKFSHPVNCQPEGFILEKNLHFCHALRCSIKDNFTFAGLIVFFHFHLFSWFTRRRGAAESAELKSVFPRSPRLRVKKGFGGQDSSGQGSRVPVLGAWMVRKHSALPGQFMPCLL